MPRPGGLANFWYDNGAVGTHERKWWIKPTEMWRKGYDTGKWPVASGQWLVISGQWSVVSGSLRDPYRSRYQRSLSHSLFVRLISLDHSLFIRLLVSEDLKVLRRAMNRISVGIFYQD